MDESTTDEQHEEFKDCELWTWKDVSTAYSKSDKDKDEKQTVASKDTSWSPESDPYFQNMSTFKLKPRRRATVYKIVLLCVFLFITGMAVGGVLVKYVLIHLLEKTSTPAEVAQSGNQSDTAVSLSTDDSVVSLFTKIGPRCYCPSESLTTEQKPCSACATRNPDMTNGSERETSPFAPLSYDEMVLTNWVLRAHGYVGGNTITSNRITHMYLFAEQKERVLNYLDNNATFPGRYAHVHVVRGARYVPDVMEYKVGPLTSIANATIHELTRSGDINFNRRPYDPAEYPELQKVVAGHLKAMNQLLNESFDGATYNGGIDKIISALPSVKENDRLSLMTLYLTGMGFNTVRLLPVTCIVHHPGTDSTAWYASDFYYASQGPFRSGQELQDRYNGGYLRKLNISNLYRSEHADEYDLKFNSSLPKRNLSDLPPPRTYEPKGPRYTIKGHRATWMDWEFEFSSNPIRGPALFDISFKGQRIAYEISLQDITLIYSSQTNGAGQPALTDTVFSIGTYNTPRFGLDCPERSSVLNASKFWYFAPRIMQAACIFEADGQRTLWRHGSRGLADHHLILRTSLNLGNYDYTVEWKFFLDGSLETLISASGFLYGAFWDPNDPYVDTDKTFTPFGYRISDYLLGPIHDHNYVFKVDLDILGTRNSFEMLHWKAGDTLDAFKTASSRISSKPRYFYFDNTRYVVPEILQTETSFFNDPLKPKYWKVVNENEKNYWGNKRGYRIIPYSKSGEVLRHHLMSSAWNHLNFHLAVTKRKDTEQTGSTSWYDLQYPVRPVGGVGRMLDKDIVRHEDLVLWISEKFLHAPSAEDIPMTVSVPSGFLLKPYNYFDRTPVFDVQAHYRSNPYVNEPCYEDIP